MFARTKKGAHLHLLFIDNIYGPLLVVSTISFVQLFKQYELEIDKINNFI